MITAIALEAPRPFNLDQAVDAANRWGTAAALLGALAGGLAGAIAGTPAGGVGALPGAGLGAGLGSAALGALGFLGGFAASSYRQLAARRADR